LTDTPAPGSRRRRRGGRGRTKPTGAAPAPHGHAHTAHPTAKDPAADTAKQKTPHQRAVSSRESAPFDPAPLPFASLSIDESLRDALDQRGFVQTTPIQSAVLPYALAGKDVIGCAETGTGKTAAYLLPILTRLLKEDRADGLTVSRGHTRALILAPTRELATQIDDEIQGFAYHAPLSSVAVYGGVPMEPQERALKAGVDIVVATPGRLLDHQRSKVGDYSKLEVFVLDEADRMMDMGFWPDVQRIAALLPPSTLRQTMLFSATMPEEVMKFADSLAPGATFLLVGSRRGPAQTITHEARVMQLRDKIPVLAKVLRRGRTTAIVFVNTKIGCDRLATQLRKFGLHAEAIHADRTQDARTRALEAFRAGHIRVLVATDVAARGLDIESVGIVVNYEVPRSLETYVHRVGRTGRKEELGHALTLAEPSEQYLLNGIEKAFGLTFID
jgi:ATP-dependent RNA helicase RhlE